MNGNVKTVVDALGAKTVLNYDYEDRPTDTTEASGTADERTKAVLTRDKMGNPLQVQDYNGNVSTTAYNALYLPKKVCDPVPFAAQCTETTYYKTGKVKTVKNRRGYTTQFEYDALGRETKVIDPLNQTVETTYDKVGNVKTKKDKRGIIAENFYDSLYRPTETHRAGIRLVTNEYDDAGNKSAVIDANNNWTEYDYTNRNLLEITHYPDTTIETRAYDGVGNVLTVTNEENKVTTYTYDNENRQTSVEFANEKTEKGYDAVGNVTSTTKPLGNKRTMEYDRLKRPMKVIDDPTGLGLVTRFEYDANGNLRHQYDPRGNHVEYGYDALNRKTKHAQHKASGNLTTQYTYDEEGNLSGMMDPKGQSFTYVYDELNRRTDENLPTGSTTPYLTPITIHTDYDANNNVGSITETKKATDGATLTDTTINTYDNFDRLETNNQRGITITYGYDNNGNRTLVSSPTGSTTYTFNNRNWLETTNDGTSATTFTYYPDGKRDAVTYPNGAAVKYTYWPTNRFKTVSNTSGGNVISSYAYEYDKNGNRTSQAEVQDGTTETTAYTYDSLDRLSSFLVTDSTGTTTNTEYTFEGYNRKTEKVTQNGTVTTSKTYTYDETDWLTKIVDNADTANIRTINYAYDRNGNTIQKSDSLVANENKTFDYDSLNRLVQTKGGNGVVLGLYDYNAEGLRIRHRYSDRGDVDYFYDGKAVIEEQDASNGSLLAHYRYADRLLSLNSAQGTQYYHYDALGSTVNLTDASGTTQVSYNLDPWGHIKSQTGLSINRHIFTGKEYDANTGLIDFGARLYDPDTARFITQDTYLGEPGTPTSLHRYLYAYSNPTVYVDLQGYLSEYFMDVLGLKSGEFDPATSPDKGLSAAQLATIVEHANEIDERNRAKALSQPLYAHHLRLEGLSPEAWRDVVLATQGLYQHGTDIYTPGRIGMVASGGIEGAWNPVEDIAALGASAAVKAGAGILRTALTAGSAALSEVKGAAMTAVKTAQRDVWEILAQSGIKAEQAALTAEARTGSLATTVTSETAESSSYLMRMLRNEKGGGQFNKRSKIQQIASETSVDVTTREGIVNRVEEIVEQYVKQIKELYPDAKIGFRGSLARGTKGPHKQNAPFDPQDFDVDAFIVSDELSAALPKPKRGWQSGNQVEALRDIQREIDKALKNILPGLRKDEDFVFRVWTREQFEKQVGIDERYLIK